MILMLGFLNIRALPADEPDANSVGFKHFITRSGDRLMDGDMEYRFIGANMPGLTLPYDYFYGIEERMVLPTPWEQEDAFKTLSQMGMTCLRTWNLPIAFPGEQNAGNFKAVLGPGQFNEEAFLVIDRMLALANRYGIRVLFPLTADYGDFLGGVTAYAEHRGEPAVAFYTDRRIKEDYKSTVAFVLNRMNTVTGTPYKEDKAILAWQFGNEMDRTRPGEEVQRAWQAEMAAYIKSIDPDHLLAYGRRFIPEEPDENVDIVIHHYYRGDWPKQLAEHREKTRGKRPFVITEFGLETDPEKYRVLLDGIIEHGIAGAMVWSMYFHHRDGGFWHHGIITKDGLKSYHWPGFPENDAVGERDLMRLLRNAAYGIRNRDVPPLPVPESPVLLSVGETPLMRWRGSAGAAFYRVECSGTGHDPWTTIASGVSDGDVTYRPNFADSTAVAGERRFYRIVACNASGESPPSNIIGPVDIERGVLVDTMKNFDLLSGRSEGIRADHRANYYYAEHYYRARGTVKDWIRYDIPEGCALDGLFLSVWKGDGVPELILLGSTDGNAWHPIVCERKIVEMNPYYPKKQWENVRVTECRYWAEELGDRFKFLKVEWKNECLLDRVELYFK